MLVFQEEDLQVVELATQFLHSQLPPHYNPRDARHTFNDPTMSYSAVEEVAKTSGSTRASKGQLDEVKLRVLEKDLVEGRAAYTDDSGQDWVIEVAMRDEEGEEMRDGQGVVRIEHERTGVTHLVHAWYPQGQKVSS